MERENLRRMLAFAIIEELGTHQLTMPNVERYVLPRRTKYCIKKEEKITETDKMIAMFIVLHACAQKPIVFRYARGQVWTQQRKEFMMSCDLPVDKSYKF